MSNEVVKYDNKLNSVTLRNFTAVQLDLFIALCSKMRDKGTDEICFTFDEIKELIHYDKTTNETRFIYDLREMYRKMLSCYFWYVEDMTYIEFVLFIEYAISLDKQTVKVAVNPKFKWALNELSSSFTRFELEEFLHIKSSYAKECYRRLKQFRRTGVWRVNLDEFKRQLDVPPSYKISDFRKRVLNPIKKELPKYFNHFRIKEIRKNTRGRQLIGLEFTFDLESKYEEPIVPKKEKYADGSVKPPRSHHKYTTGYRYVESIPDYKNAPSVTKNAKPIDEDKIEDLLREIDDSTK